MNKIFYFTGTGNSLWTVKQLLSQLPAFEMHSAVNIVNRSNKEDITRCDSIGFVFPVYLYGPPLIATKFLSTLYITEKQYTFYIGVHGGYLADTINVVRKVLKKNNGHLNAGFGLKMPGNCIIDYSPPEKEIIEQRIRESKKRIIEIADFIKNRRSGHFEMGNHLGNWLLTGILYKLLIRTLPGYSKKFVVEDRCNSCEICKKVCPVSNIKIENNRPIWGSYCEMCLACIQNCPVEAIQWGKRTKKRSRYRNPYISIRELQNQKENMGANL
jgi:ferredoxin